MGKKIKLFSGGLVISVLFATLFFSALPQRSSVDAGVNNGYYGKKAKYIFYFIGDGMGMPQITATEIFKGTLSSNHPMNKESLSFTVFPHLGMQTTHSANSFITDSAAAGTALATGHKTDNNVLGMDPTKRIKFKTIAEMAKAKGLKVGIISSVSLDHATPAAFYAHEGSRTNQYDIGIAMVNSGFDYFAGGSLLQPTGKAKDKMNVLEIAKQTGYKIVNEQDSIMKLTKNDGKVIAFSADLAAESAMQYSIDRKNRITLADYTKKGIEMLDNPMGFFMMVEGGKIDWSSHANDAATTVQDVLAFDQAVIEALKFYAQHPDETLIVVTGDHETGGMTVGFAGTKYTTAFKKISQQTLSFEEFDKVIKDYRTVVGSGGANLEDWLSFLSEKFGLTEFSDFEESRLQDSLAASMKDSNQRTTNEQAYLLYGGYEPFSVTVTHLLNQRAGIGWTTYAHTGVALPLYAQGVGGELFEGSYDNTDVAKKIMNIMGGPISAVNYYCRIYHFLLYQKA